MRIAAAAFLLVIVIAVLAWSPWLSESRAASLSQQAFAAAWDGVIDGCGLNCQGCGVTQVRKTWFGYRANLEYACGLLPGDSPEFHQNQEVFVSFWGSVHGVPEP